MLFRSVQINRNNTFLFIPPAALRNRISEYRNLNCTSATAYPFNERTLRKDILVCRRPTTDSFAERDTGCDTPQRRSFHRFAAIHTLNHSNHPRPHPFRSCEKAAAHKTVGEKPPRTPPRPSNRFKSVPSYALAITGTLTLRRLHRRLRRRGAVRAEYNSYVCRTSPCRYR